MKIHINNKKLILFLALLLLLSKSAKAQSNKQQSKKSANIEYKMAEFGDQVFDLVTTKYLDKLLGLLPNCANDNLTYTQQLQQLERYRNVVYDSCLRHAYKEIDSLRKVWKMSVSVANNEYSLLRIMANQTVIETFWYRDYYNVLQNLGQRRPIPVNELNGMLDAVQLTVFQLNTGYEDLPKNVWLRVKNELLDCVAIKDTVARCARLQKYPEFLKSVFESLNRSGYYGWVIEWYNYYLLNLWFVCSYHYGCVSEGNPQQNTR